jgi:mRNA interferase RelE/StbE
MSDEKWVTRIRPRARDDLRTLPKATALRILKKITELETNPSGLDTTDLVDDPGYRRLRIGDYRVVYTLDHGQLTIWVVAVGHRSAIYRHLSGRQDHDE